MVARGLRFDGRVPAELRDAVLARALPLRTADDLTPLFDQIGNARLVLLGEASHGTSEYYVWRRRISERLIAEKGFSFVAVEGDWPDCYAVNRFVKGWPGAGNSTREVLHVFDRWPTWMWANEEIVGLLDWLRDDNHDRAEPDRVGFYGLDVYSLHRSLEAVVEYAERIGPEPLEAARNAYRCFEPYSDVETYARATRWLPASCEDEATQLLVAMLRQAREYDHDGRDGLFNAQQNALVVRNAETYYRTMMRGRGESWNVRDTHMADTLDRLLEHHGPNSKAIVWAHNTHIGDARATDMAAAGMTNIGQLARERHAADGVVLVGFGSHRGSVIAGSEWGAPMERMPVPQAEAGCWEHVLHDVVGDDCLLPLAGARRTEAVRERRGHRAIGVVYHPDYEHYGNYVPTVLPERYDALLYLDETSALHPLPVPVEADVEEPQTYPAGT